MAGVLSNQGKYEEALQAYQEVYEKRVAILGADHLHTLTTKNNMAVVLDNLGKYEEALQAYQEVYEKRVAKLGAHHPSPLSTKNIMAGVLLNQGKYEEALQAYQEVYEKRVAILGADHLHTLNTKNNMAGVLSNQGKYEEALQAYQEVYEKRVAKLGADHLDTLTTKNNMAVVLDKQGKYEEALQAYQEVHQKRMAILGADHPDTLNTKNSMAGVLDKQGKYEEALRAYQEVYEKRVAILGADHPSTLSTKNIMARVLDNQGQYEEALQAYQEVYEKRVAILGADHLHTLNTKNNMAGVLSNQGKYEEALQAYQEVYEKRVAKFGADHLDTLTTKNNMAVVLDNLGKYEEALRANQEVYEKRVAILGADHPSTLSTKNNMARVLDNQGQYEEALQAYQEVHQKRMAILGADHPSTLSTKNIMARVLDNQGQYEEALQAYQEVYEKRVAILGADHLHTLNTKNNMAGVLSNQGKYEEALQAYQEVYEKRVAKLGADHVDTLTTKNNMAGVLSNQGKYEEALQAYQEVYEKRVAKFGADHLDTLTTKNNMAVVLDKQGKYTSLSTSNWLDYFNFDSFLGHGTFGVALKATAKSSHLATPTAIKFIFLDPDQTTRTEEKRRIDREFNNVVDKRHRNIVHALKLVEMSLKDNEIDSIFEGMTLDSKVQDKVVLYSTKARRLGELDTICIQMELCGHTLGNWLTAERTRKVYYTQIQICQGLIAGLKFLHKNKILHRDLNPRNIYFSREYSLPIKIGDFGLCRELHHDTSSLTQGIGTQDYMAPEVHTKKYSFQADLYSLGLVIWEVLQQIPKQNRTSLFDRLVNGNEQSLVKDHTVFVNAKEVIINLTKRIVEDRTKSVKRLELTVKENYKIVTNAEELIKFLMAAEPGDVILIADGIFIGNFLLNQKQVVLRGIGEGTMLRNDSKGTKSSPSSALKIKCNDCKVISIKVVCTSEEYTCGVDVNGSNNTIKDTKFEGGLHCLKVRGDDNNCSNVSGSNATSGIVIKGVHNMLDSTRIKEMTKIGIDIDGRDNIVDTLTCENVWCGVHLDGDDNKLRNIQCHNSETIAESDGVWIKGGSGNLVEGLKSSGFTDHGLVLSSSAKNSVVRDSFCDDGIVVEGTHQSLICVDAGKELVVRSSGHMLEKCKAKKFTTAGTTLSVSITECIF